jgi:hypothetical protein
LRRDVDWASFGCLLVPVNAFRAVGPLDAGLVAYYDVDFCARARKAGFRILLQPGAIVYLGQRASASLNASESQLDLQAGGEHRQADEQSDALPDRSYLVRRHAGPIRRTTFWLYLLAAKLPQLTGAVRSRDAPALLRQFRDLRHALTGNAKAARGSSSPQNDASWTSSSSLNKR